MPDIQEGDEVESLDAEPLNIYAEEALANAPEPVADNEPPEFDPRYAEPFEGLLYIGALTKEFEWLGHTFVIRTLTTNEILIVPLIIKKWEGTIGAARAYGACMVALATISVDGQSLPTPVETSPIGHEWALQRFNHVTGRWFPYTIDRVYSEYLELESEAVKTVEAMGNAFG
jgi:hypothetical protein